MRRIRPLDVDYGYVHRHPEFEICWFPRDAGTFLIQDREYPIRPGDVFIVNANDVHQPVLRQARNDGALVVYFSARLFADAPESAEWLNAFFLASQTGRNRLGAQPRVAALMTELHATLEEQDAHWQLASRGVLAHILALVAREFLRGAGAASGAGSTPPAPLQMHRFARVVEYVNQNLHLRLESTRLYAMAGLSRSQFCEAFRATFGMSLARYIRLQRLRRAMRLLKSTALPVTRVAEQAGFASGSFFSAVFKRHTGVSPNRYRRA